jgi:hypothetical protein
VAFEDCGVERAAAAESPAGVGGDERGREESRDGRFGAGSSEGEQAPRPWQGRLWPLHVETSQAKVLSYATSPIDQRHHTSSRAESQA